MAENLHNNPIVLDNGSGTIRAGFAGEEAPKSFFPSFVGRTKHPRVLAGGLEGDTFIGNRASELKGLLKIRYPLEHGIVTDWNDMELIWHHVYEDGLKTLSEEVCTRMRAMRISADSSGPIAPSPPHRASLEPKNKSRHRGPDPLRDLQCPRPLLLHPSSPLSLRLRSHHWSSLGFR